MELFKVDIVAPFFTVALRFMNDVKNILISGNFLFCRAVFFVGVEASFSLSAFKADITFAHISTGLNFGA